MRFSRSPQGHDGFSADVSADWTTALKITSSPVLGIPELRFAASQCDHCGTSDGHSGRPGSSITGLFTCRSCKRQNVINGGRGYEYQGSN